MNRKRDGQQVVSFGFCLLNTFVISNTINYIYNASGQKVEKIVKDGATTITTNYLDGFQYKDNVLEFFPTAEGYAQNENGVLGYVFQYKDHLGNVRVSYKINAQNVLEIVEENNYYPFGLKHKGYNHYVQGSVKNRYKYNGKELQDELGLGMYDYGARNYDPALGRWMNIDPLAEMSRRFSPYTYALNNPVYFIDPDGMKAEAGQSGNYYDWDEGQYKNKDTGKTVTADEAITSHNGGSEEGGNGDKESQEGPGKGTIHNLPKKGDKVLVDVTAKSRLGKIWSFIQGDRDWTDSTTGLTYVIGDNGSILRQKPLGGAGGLEYISGAGEIRIAIQFGSTENQIYHAFRHMDDLGIARPVVKAAIKAHLPSVVNEIKAGEPLNKVIEVAGHRIQYSVYRLPDGTLNIGRIHGI